MIHIAVIDDEIQITSMLQKMLSKNRDVTVSTFNNPVAALDKLIAFHPDVVLLDIMMPQMDGVEVLKRLKQECPGTNVIMMTAYSTLDKVLACHKLGAENYILKPFESLSDVEQKVMQLAKKGNITA